MPRLTLPPGENRPFPVPCMRPAADTAATASAYQADAGTSRKAPLSVPAPQAVRAAATSSPALSWDSSQKPMPPRERSRARRALAAMETGSS